MTRLWDKGAPLDERVLAYTAGEDYALDERLVRYDVRASIAHARDAAARRSCCRTTDLQRDRSRARSASPPSTRTGTWHIELSDEDGQTALEKRLTARIGEAGGRVHLGRSRNDQVLTALRLYLRDAVECARAPARSASPMRWIGSATRESSTALPGYTHMQQAMPSSVPLWAGGFAAELRDDADGLRARAAARRQESARLRRRLWHAGLPLDRERHARRARLRRDARARDGRAALARQGRSAACCSRSRC